MKFLVLMAVLAGCAGTHRYTYTSMTNGYHDRVKMYKYMNKVCGYRKWRITSASVEGRETVRLQRGKRYYTNRHVITFKCL